MAQTRQQRIEQLSKKLIIRLEKKNEKNESHKKRRPFIAKERTRTRRRNIIAYDFETSSIEAGTPTLKYLTAYNEKLDFCISVAVNNLHTLQRILQSHFLTDDLKQSRFVAWNANHFDVYFIAASLLHSNDYILRPYLTKSKTIRGLKVIDKNDEKIYWEFLDGMSMTGITKPLSSFLKIFAPEYTKLENVINFEAGEQFDASNPAHVEYAMRDSVGLWHAMQNAEKITMENFNLPLQPTIGNLGIKAFQSFLPSNITIWALPADVERIIKNQVMRGGYCYCNKKYYGKVWKYDINQAYAAAMRETNLPAGAVFESKEGNKYAKCAIFLVDATNYKNKVPFYWRDSEEKSHFSLHEIKNAWLTSIEIKQLESEKWKITVKNSYFWEDYFRMTKYVNTLENLRVGEGRDPKSAQGEMIKAIGNNSYGKTVETLGGVELLLSLDCPPGFAPYQGDDEIFKHIWFKFNEPGVRDYHQPHIGAFITARVRMVLRAAILKNPDAWIYADTDGVMFSEPVALDFSPTRYGAWKIEAEGEIFRIITKKVYANEDASEKHAKGVNISRLTAVDFENWYNGQPPVQTQIQRANFLTAMTGGEMFFKRTKVGQKL
jgi:hypothetical protein